MFGIKSIDFKYIVYNKATGQEIQLFDKRGHALNYIKKLKVGGAMGYDELNNMLDASYKTNEEADESIDGYNLDKEISNDYGKVYHNPNTNHTVVAHRGTQGIADWKNNLAYVTGQYEKTDRFKTGKRIQDQAQAKYGTDNLSTVAHSQGAILARKLGSKSKEIINVNPAYLFEKPHKNEYNIRSQGDIVSKLYEPVSAIRRILYPNYSKRRDHLITSNKFYINPITRLKQEHSYSILTRVNGSIGK